MINIELLVSVISLGLIVALVLTKAYNRSITTTIYVVSLAISMQFCYSGVNHFALIPITIGAILSLGRAVVNHDTDKLIKR
jgi:hypothetical protein